MKPTQDLLSDSPLDPYRGERVSGGPVEYSKTGGKHLTTLWVNALSSSLGKSPLDPLTEGRGLLDPRKARKRNHAHTTLSS